MESIEGVDVNLTTKPKYEVNSKLVPFGEPGAERFLVGIELDIPISPILRDRLRNSDGKIDLSDNIKGIKYLELAGDFYGTDVIVNPEKYVDATPTKDAGISDRAGILAARLLSILRNETQSNTEDFNKVLRDGKGESLVIIHGHGDSQGYIGPNSRESKYTSSDDSKVSVTREEVHLSQLLSRYDNPSLYSAIVVAACNERGRMIRPRKVPIFYPRSVTALVGTDRIAKTLPQKDLLHLLKWYFESMIENKKYLKEHNVLGT